MKSGSRLKSQVCDTQVIVVKASTASQTSGAAVPPWWHWTPTQTRRWHWILR